MPTPTATATAVARPSSHSCSGRCARSGCGAQSAARAVAFDLVDKCHLCRRLQRDRALSKIVSAGSIRTYVLGSSSARNSGFAALDDEEWDKALAIHLQP